jgi:hypothetical protein
MSSALSVIDKNSISIHTSDRVLFKRCRRRWNWSSPLRENLEPEGASHSALWFGSGFHFALEDYHGYNLFGHPIEAFRAYGKATDPKEIPADAAELWDLAQGMLNHYVDNWLPRRKHFKTFWINGIPQVEVPFSVRIPDTNAVYEGTFDRVVVDPYKRLWVLDYKTAKQIETGKLETDPQVTAYTWAARLFYGERVQGTVWQQHLKAVPNLPVHLKGGGFSQNKNQKTTHAIYKKALKEQYGGVPTTYVDFLNLLAERETPEGDGFIHLSLIERNTASTNSEVMKIYAETRDMTNPHLPLYPNPTRDCSWDCPFRVPCIALDDGSDWQQILEEGYTKKNYGNERLYDTWRSRIQWPTPPLQPAARLVAA